MPNTSANNIIVESFNEITVVEATTNPLSADVVIIKGKENYWVYDVGCNDNSYDEIQSLNHKNIVISHFHPDHMGNLERFEFDNLYVGKNTYNYSKQGNIVTEEMIFDNNNIRIIPIPSAHAKGCLALLVEDKCLLVGDALYPKHKGDASLYNVQHLKSQIDLLKKIEVEYIGLSHQKDFFQKKACVLDKLQEIYDKRKANEAYIAL